MTAASHPTDPAAEARTGIRAELQALRERYCAQANALDAAFRTSRAPLQARCGTIGHVPGEEFSLPAGSFWLCQVCGAVLGGP